MVIFFSFDNFWVNNPESTLLTAGLATSSLVVYPRYVLFLLLRAHGISTLT